MNKVKGFVKRETVLSAAVILAILSAMVIRPDREYGSYIDYKTIGLLFCLMTVMAGLQSLGVFKKAGERLLGYVKGLGLCRPYWCSCVFSSAWRLPMMWR